MSWISKCLVVSAAWGVGVMFRGGGTFVSTEDWVEPTFSHVSGALGGLGTYLPSERTNELASIRRSEFVFGSACVSDTRLTFCSLWEWKGRPGQLATRALWENDSRPVRVYVCVRVYLCVAYYQHTMHSIDSRHPYDHSSIHPHIHTSNPSHQSASTCTVPINRA